MSPKCGGLIISAPKICDSCDQCKGGDPLERIGIDPSLLCTLENCKIYATNDVPFYPKPKEVYRRRIKTEPALEAPMGLVFSTVEVKCDPKNPNEAEHFATILKAFTKIYLMSEKKWTSEVIDAVIAEGELLFQDSKNHEQDEVEENNNEIYSDAEQQIKREFDMEGLIFQVELSDKFEIQDTYRQGRRLSPSKIGESEYEGESETPNYQIPDIPFSEFNRHIRAFYKTKKYGLIKFKNQYILAWHAHGVYFVLDLYGRNTINLTRDYEGLAVIFCFKNLNNVEFFIQNMCDVHLEKDQFNIRELMIVKLTTLDGRTYSLEYGIRASQYDVINWDYAFLRSNLHLTLNRANVLRNRSALPVGIAALLATKIDHPATWDKKMLDKIICYGVNVCQLCWLPCLNKGEPINLDLFPDKLKMGQFWFSYQLKPMNYNGLWKCITTFDSTELWMALQKAFDNGDNKLLLQISSQMYAVWRKGTYYYIFDPYRHRIDGYVVSDNEDQKSATLRMCCRFKTFMSVLNNILLQNTKTARFYLHSLKVTQISVHMPQGVEGDLDVDLMEVKSINESICFFEDPKKCLDLALISDFEEEEEEIPISEYEEEEIPGEEEHIEQGVIEKLVGNKGSKRVKQKGEEDVDDDKEKKSKTRKNPMVKKVRREREENADQTVKPKKGDKVGTDSKNDVTGLNDVQSGKEDKDVKGDKDGKSNKSKVTSKNGGTKNQAAPDNKAKKEKKLSGDYDARRRKPLDFDELRADKKKVICGNDDDDITDKCQVDTEKDVYPGYGTTAHDMVVVGSESGTYESICGLLRSAFKCADRVLCMTPWSNYVVFRGWNYLQKVYFLFDGCTCNVNRFRYLDISCGTNAMMSFSRLHDVIKYMVDCQQMRTTINENREKLVDDICQQYSV